MNTLILNRDGFSLPTDGWYQLTPFGEFPHAQADVIQVLDRVACEAMVRQFRRDAGIEPADKLKAERFPGLLVDFDHSSLDTAKPSTAAGWIVALEGRGQEAG